MPEQRGDREIRALVESPHSTWITTSATAHSFYCRRDHHLCHSSLTSLWQGSPPLPHLNHFTVAGITTSATAHFTVAGTATSATAHSLLFGRDRHLCHSSLTSLWQGSPPLPQLTHFSLAGIATSATAHSLLFGRDLHLCHSSLTSLWQGSPPLPQRTQWEKSYVNFYVAEFFMLLNY